MLIHSLALPNGGMTVVRSRARSRVSAAALIAGMTWVIAACGGAEGESPESTRGTTPQRTAQSETAWREPASYVYTRTSQEQALAGSFRVTVRDGKAAKAIGLDDTSRQMLAELPGPDRIPTIGELPERLEKARREQADTVKVDYAADDRPSRIILAWDKNAIDDEASTSSAPTSLRTVDHATPHLSLSETERGPPNRVRDGGGSGGAGRLVLSAPHIRWLPACACALGRLPWWHEGPARRQNLYLVIMALPKAS